MHCVHKAQFNFFIICDALNSLGKNVRLSCRKLSTTSQKLQISETKNIVYQQENIVEYHEKLPIKFKSLDPKKDITVNLNVRVVQQISVSPIQPVMVALHGMPGDGSDFQQLSYNLAKSGIKTITPDFPGCGNSKMVSDDVYNIDYSPTGKADMLVQIINKLQLQKVDILMSHSAGSYLGFRAAAEIDTIKAAVFINFLGGKPHRYARPYKLLQMSSKVIKLPMIQSFIIPLLPKMYQSVGFAKFDSQPLQVAVENVATAEHEKIFDHIQTIKDKKKPSIFAWATTDKLVETDIPYSLLRHIGIEDPHILKLCRENKTKETGGLSKLLDHEDWYFKAIQFDRGGHLLPKNQIPELTKHIMDLIKHVNS